MTEQTKTRFPAPLYAAAGAGDLAYQQLRKLPAVVNELSDRVNELSDRAAASLKAANDQANTTATTLRDRAATTDFDKLRDTATTSAVAFAQIASERAIALYTALVARGERVVGTGVIEAAEVVNDDMVTTEEPKAVEAAEAASAAKPRQRATKAAPAKDTPTTK
jgi:heparin binding hemagglutinin HbhA